MASMINRNLLSLFLKDGILKKIFSRFLDMTRSILILLLSQELLRKNYYFWILNEIFQRLLLKIGNICSFQNFPELLILISFDQNRKKKIMSIPGYSKRYSKSKEK